ncbi:BON domain-containing protein [Roseovarius spongiae]|uniref:BON domain-containing protein n=1 Tax=Roseovarius spongiae TaxID=2320272 RepID=A0A3A8B7J7_9RHOB|nr:BON domain-containing protein [Roseovarius spongiae]RKF12651.1 BON domain-containing protein [Roseovarius spongiae]
MDEGGDWRGATGYGDPAERHEEPVYDRGGPWRYRPADYRGYRAQQRDWEDDRDDRRRYDFAEQDRVWRDRANAGYAGSRARPYEGRPEGFQGGGYQGYEGRSGLLGARHYDDDLSGPSQRGRGPRNYRRSDQRIQEDVSDRLTDDRQLDPSDIEISVTDREVTLSGEVDSKWAKRRAEDCADSVTGVEHVQNNLRVARTAGTSERATS